MLGAFGVRSVSSPDYMRYSHFTRSDCLTRKMSQTHTMQPTDATGSRQPAASEMHSLQSTKNEEWGNCWHASGKIPNEFFFFVVAIYGNWTHLWLTQSYSRNMDANVNNIARKIAWNYHIIIDTRSDTISARNDRLSRWRNGDVCERGDGHR